MKHKYDERKVRVSGIEYYSLFFIVSRLRIHKTLKSEQFVNTLYRSILFH